MIDAETARSKRVLIGTVEISGFCRRLKQGFDRIGIDAALALKSTGTYNYEGDQPLDAPIRWWIWALGLRGRTPKSRLLAKCWAVLLHELSAIVLVIWAGIRFDSLIFCFGQTITNTLTEVLWYRLLGRKLIYVFLGSDVRPPWVDGAIYHVGAEVDWDSMADLALTRKARLMQIEKHATNIVSWVPMAGLQTRRYVNLLRIGLPCTANPQEDRVPRRRVEGGVRILHAGSHPQLKGTREIAALVDELRRRGHDIDFVSLHGVSNKQVLEELARCDFVIDQLYSDTPMAMLAAEAAFFGKPSIVGGYFAGSVAAHLDAGEIPPTLFVHPDELLGAVEDLLHDEQKRLDLGRRAQAFVRTRWSPESVASGFLRVIRGDIPDAWWSDPAATTYLHGHGVPEWRARELVAGLIAARGEESLCMEDKPALVRAYREFAAECTRVGAPTH